MRRYLRLSLAVTLSFFALFSFAASPLDSLLLYKDASGYAGRIASMIDDRPEGLRFKQEILAQSKNSSYAGSTMSAIADAKNKANAAGCSSPNATGTGVNGAANKAGQAISGSINDAHGYALRIASHIADRPECEKYKIAIMAHATSRMGSGATAGPIVQASQDARRAGCSK